jgi:hypothetical protein
VSSAHEDFRCRAAMFLHLRIASHVLVRESMATLAALWRGAVRLGHTSKATLYNYAVNYRSFSARTFQSLLHSSCGERRQSELGRAGNPASAYTEPRPEEVLPDQAQESPPSPMSRSVGLYTRTTGGPARRVGYPQEPKTEKSCRESSWLGSIRRPFLDAHASAFFQQNLGLLRTPSLYTKSLFEK